MDYRHEWRFAISASDLFILRQRLRAVARPDSHAVGGRHGDGMPGFQGQADKQDMRPPEDAAFFEEGEPPDRMDVPDDERHFGRMESPDDGNFPDRRAMWEDNSTSDISTNTLTLTGISMLVLLFGLLIAVKIKH